ncbi:MAG TPA: class I SAM-dependent methyltransferase [Gemmatimonadaceae bacterium]
MKPGQPSQTAMMVGASRAAAHGNTDVARFSDPTALALLSKDARLEVERFRAGAKPSSVKERLRQAYLSTASKVMAVRTVAIDDAIRAAANPQLVILGAGFDGRAWRMSELRNVVVFEVDHPDTQREKRERVGKLKPSSTDIRFVPVDFQHDSLDAALSSAGHDATHTTTWVWEGVIMYLSAPAIDATLDVIARRSVRGSRLVVLYHAKAFLLRVVGFVVRRMGEPLKSSFTPNSMRALLGRFGFRLQRDGSLHDFGVELSPTVGEFTKRTQHMRIAIADRV